MPKKPIGNYERAINISGQRECMGSLSGHRWTPSSNTTGIVCSKCGQRGLNRDPFPFTLYKDTK